MAAPPVPIWQVPLLQVDFANRSLPFSYARAEPARRAPAARATSAAAAK